MALMVLFVLTKTTKGHLQAADIGSISELNGYAKVVRGKELGAELNLGIESLDNVRSDNTVTYTGTGVNASSGGYMWLDHTGGSRTINITQASTLNNDWVKITSNGSNGTFCVDQNDQGTATGC